MHILTSGTITIPSVLSVLIMSRYLTTPHPKWLFALLDAWSSSLSYVARKTVDSRLIADVTGFADCPRDIWKVEVFFSFLNLPRVLAASYSSALAIRCQAPRSVLSSGSCANSGDSFKIMPTMSIWVF
jgi:hypothetical protein